VAITFSLFFNLLNQSQLAPLLRGETLHRFWHACSGRSAVPPVAILRRELPTDGNLLYRRSAIQGELVFHTIHLLTTCAFCGAQQGFFGFLSRDRVSPTH